MDKATQLAARLTHELLTLRGTQESLTLELGSLFLQAASYDRDAVLIEIPSNNDLPVGRLLATEQEEELLRLGFTRPTQDMPNWWIGVEDGNERLLFAAARATVRALLDIHHVNYEALTSALPLFPATRPADVGLPKSAKTVAEGEPIGVQSNYGQVLLYPNGFATLNGEPWDERPVVSWAALGDGRLTITLATPSTDHFPHLAFVPDTPTHVAVLRRFLPVREDLESLMVRLAVAEQYCLTCITTGTLYHEELAAACRRLEDADKAGKASELVGWDAAPRLTAAVNAVSAFYWSHSADNAWELHDDQEDTWKAIQTWVRSSPWRDDFDFEIIPSRSGTGLAGPEVQIQRAY